MNTVTLIVAVLATLTFLVVFLPQESRTLESYFLHDRNLRSWRGALAYTAVWTQPLALFASGAFAYKSVWHFLAFAAPNVVAIALVVMVGPALQRAHKRGYTLPEVFEHVFGGFVGSVLRSVFAIFAVITVAYIMAINLTMLQAANQASLRLWVGSHLGMSAATLTIVIGILAYLWASPRGIRGAIVGDISKVLCIFLGSLGVASLWAILPAGSETIVPPAGFSAVEVFWKFGVPVTVSLIGAAIANPEMIERKFAIEEKGLVRSALAASVLFTIILLAYGSFGFLARYLGMTLAGNQLPLLEVIKLVPFAEPVVLTLVIVTLVTSLTSALASAGNIWGVELIKRLMPRATEAGTILWSRIFILLTLAGGFAMAFYVNDISILLQNMSVVRGEMIPAVFVLLFWSRNVPSTAVLIGVVLGAIAGAYFTFAGGSSSVGASAAFLIPAVCCLFGAAMRIRSARTQKA